MDLEPRDMAEGFYVPIRRPGMTGAAFFMEGKLLLESRLAIPHQVLVKS